MYIHLHTGWYVSYTPQIHTLAHLGSVLLQLTMGPLVATVIEEQSLAKMTSILFTSDSPQYVFVILQLCLTTNSSGNIETNFSFCTVTIVFC